MEQHTILKNKRFKKISNIVSLLLEKTILDLIISLWTNTLMLTSLRILILIKNVYFLK